MVNDKKQNKIKQLQTFNKTNRKMETETLYIRFTDHINEDLKRGWSSWNFGQDGFRGSAQDLAEVIEKAIKEDSYFAISGFDIYPEDIKTTAFGELMPGYWVVIDTLNSGTEALSCHSIDAGSVEDVLSAMADPASPYSGTGDGNTVDAARAEIVYEGVSDKRQFVILRESENILRECSPVERGWLSHYDGSCTRITDMF